MKDFYLTGDVVDALAAIAGETRTWMRDELADTFADSLTPAYTFALAYMMAQDLAANENAESLNIDLENINGLFRNLDLGVELRHV